MFPIHIGINREELHDQFRELRVPYTHRDKPVYVGVLIGLGVVFPIHIGINRDLHVIRCGYDGVPYTHRDKPRGLFYNHSLKMCSLYT